MINIWFVTILLRQIVSKHRHDVCGCVVVVVFVDAIFVQFSRYCTAKNRMKAWVYLVNHFLDLSRQGKNTHFFLKIIFRLNIFYLKMGDPFIAYQAPTGNQQIVTNNVNQPPDSIKKSLQYTAFDRDMSKIEKETSSLGFAGGGAIAAIVVGIVAIALAGTALHEASDHGEDDHRFSSLIVGSGNTISGNSSFSMIGGGTANSIIQNSDNSFIGGGETNKIEVTSSSGGRSAIIAGRDHIIDTGGVASAIIGGHQNKVSGYNSVILGGEYNIINIAGKHSVILGGGKGGSTDDGNIIEAFGSAILAGNTNKIVGDVSFVAMLGGEGLSTPRSGSSFQHSTIAGKYNSFGTSEMNAIQTTPTPTEFRFMVGGGTDNNDRKNAFTVDNFGNLYFGTCYGASIFSRNSSGGFDAKAFTIQHPIEEEKWLVHSCLEGPEAGVYYRGKDVAPTTVKLPEYATKIADNFTVQITPIGQPRMMSSTEVNEDGFFDVMGDGKFHWHVTGRRLEIDPEPRKDSIIVNRWGPYTWNEKV